MIFTSGGHSVSVVETESTLRVLQSSKVEWIEESRLDKTWTTRAKDNGGAERRSKSKQVEGRQRWRGRAGSAVIIKASGSENETMLAHRRLFISDTGKQPCNWGGKGKGTRCCTGSAGLQRTSPGPAIGLLFGSMAPVQRPPHHGLVPSLQTQTHQRS